MYQKVVDNLMYSTKVSIVLNAFYNIKHLLFLVKTCFI